MKSHGGVRGENGMNFSPITDEKDNLWELTNLTFPYEIIGKVYFQHRLKTKEYQKEDDPRNFWPLVKILNKLINLLIIIITIIDHHYSE